MARSSCNPLWIAGVTLALLAGAASGAFAQNAVLHGTVRSDFGELVEGASVLIPEMVLQTATGADGRFLLSVPASRVQEQTVTLVVRMVGFRPSRQAITMRAGEQTFDIRLVADVNRLEDIVVTGVMEGTPQTATTFSVGRLNVADLPVPAVDPLSQLAGQMPGVYVSGTSGRPGTGPEVILRGPTSINVTFRGSDPLYIIDGVILSGGLPSINPQDIENIEVVKGAAGASLYGARAGNGVINITTKSGRTAAEGLSFRVRSEVGFGDIEREIELARNNPFVWDERGERACALDTSQPLCARTFDWLTELARVNNAPGDFALTPQTLLIDVGVSAVPTSVLRQTFSSHYWPVPTYDGVRQVTTGQPFVSTTADATGRVGGTQYFASLSHLWQQGAILYLDGFQRYSARLNLDQRVGANLALSFRSYFSHILADGWWSEIGQLWLSLTRQPASANLLARDTLGRLYIRTTLQGNTGNLYGNPLNEVANKSDDESRDRFIGGLTMRWTPTAWVDVEADFSYDKNDFRVTRLVPRGTRLTYGPNPSTGSIYSLVSGGQSYNGSLNLALRRTLGRDLEARWSFRYLFEQQDAWQQGVSATGLAVVGVDVLNNANTTSKSISSRSTTQRMIGLFAGANLEYRRRYIADLLLRRDGSSLFGVNDRWATFGRASFAWRLSQEGWWPLRSALNEFKLRASYGTAGGRPNVFAQYETYTLTDGVLSAATLGNKDLRPEITAEREVGADIELFRRVGVTLTHAASETRDQILPVTLPSSAGFSQQWQNAGTLSNRSWELSVNVPVVRRRELSWSWRFNWDRTRTVITKLDVPPFRLGLGASGMINVAEGERYGAIYGDYFLKGAGDCARLPAPFQADCGTETSAYQVNSDGWLVWVGSGNTVRDGLARNLWMAQLPATDAPWGVALNWGMPIVLRDSTGVAADTRLGSSLPDWRFSISQTFQWRRLTLYALLEGVMGRSIWNDARSWSLVDLSSRAVDQRGRDPGDAKPVGYYWRSAPPENSAGLGGLYHAGRKPVNSSVESASFAKLRELAVSYRLGRILGVGNWEVSLIGRNVFTVTKYSGYDPETGYFSYGFNTFWGVALSGTVHAVDEFNFPNLRTFTFALSTSF